MKVTIKLVNASTSSDLKVGDLVTYGKSKEFKGKVRAINVIKMDGKRVTVYDVKWNGNPSGIPMRCKDTGGDGTKAGYPLENLTKV